MKMKTLEIKLYGESIGVYNAMENIEESETWSEIKEKVLGAVHRIELAIDRNKEVTGLKDNSNELSQISSNDETSPNPDIKLNLAFCLPTR